MTVPPYNSQPGVPQPQAPWTGAPLPPPQPQPKKHPVLAKVLVTIGVIVVVIIVAFVVMIVHDAKRDLAATFSTPTPTKPTGPTNLSLDQVEVGDCVQDAKVLTGKLFTIAVTPCDRAHNGEIVGMTTTGNTWDAAYAEDFCRAQFASYIGKSFDDSKLTMTFLQPESSTSSDKTLTCIAYHVDGTTDTKSLKGSKI